MIVPILLIIALLLQVLAIILHSTGLYLLRCLCIEGKDEVQQVYMTNLSVIEILTTVCFMLVTLSDLVISNAELVDYTNIVLLTVCSLLIYMNMVYIVVDKTLQVYWNIKYNVYWSIQRAKYLVLATWFVGIICCIGILIQFSIKPFDYSFRLVNVLRPLLDVFFLIIVVASYAYIFHKYRISRLQDGHQSSASTTAATTATSQIQPSIWSTFCQSRFFLSVCLITTFVLFVILPDIIHMCTTADNPDLQNIITILLYIISYICDVFVYIFLDADVKKMLYKKLRTSRRGECMGNNKHDRYENSNPAFQRQS